MSQHRSLFQAQMLVGPIPHVHAALPTRRDRTAVIEGDRRLTWSEVAERTSRLAHVLRERGVRRGDKVAALLQNRVEYPEVVFALAGLGATVVPLSYRFVAPEIASALTHADVVAVVLDPDLVDVFDAANAEVGIDAGRVLVVGTPGETAVAADRGWDDYETALGSVSLPSDPTGYLAADEWDVYHLAFTGGTTGRPKACEVPQRVAVQNWNAITEEIGIREHDTTLIAGPFYHGLGFVWGLQQLMVGGTVVMQRSFDPRGALELMERERTTWTPMAPTLYSMLLEVPGKEHVDVSSMRGLVCAAAPLLTATKKAMLDYFSSAGLYEYYGATEAGLYTVIKPEDQLRKERSVGLPWHGNEIRVLDHDGHAVPTGEVGVIYKRGLALGATYYKDPEATAAAFRGDWMTSGDLGRLDEEGYLYVVDRAKDMIISGGVNIFPSEIEEVLTSHPDVVSAAVVGRPDEKWGEVVTAYVVTRGGAPLDEADLDRRCRERMASYKRPRTYRHVDRLPLNSSGKLLKTELRAAEAALAAGSQPS